MTILQQYKGHIVKFRSVDPVTFQEGFSYGKVTNYSRRNDLLYVVSKGKSRVVSRKRAELVS